MKTKMAVLYGSRQPLVIEELQIPALARGQVLVRVLYSGICGSQLAEIEAKWGPDRFLPHGLGHEGSGIVEAVGRGVKKVRPGNHVIVSWIRGSGLQSPQLQYRKGKQKINAGFSNTFTEHSIVSENRLVAIDKRMPLDKAAILGCAVATAFGAVFYDADVKLGDTVVVLGTGGVGLNVIQASLLAGASKIIAIGRNDVKLQKAKEFGATQTLNFKNADIPSKIRRLTHGKGADVAFEVIGQGATIKLAYQCVRADGGRVVLIGIPNRRENILLNIQDLFRGKKIMVVSGRNFQPDVDFPRYAELYLNRKIKLDQLITHRFRLHEINKALELLKDGGKIGRAILEL